MSDYDFIKGFKNITLKDISKRLGFTPGNISSGKMSAENLHKIKLEIINDLIELIKEDRKEDLIALYLYNELLENIEKENKMLKEIIE